MEKKIPIGLLTKIGAGVAVLIGILIINPFTIIGAGERGVLVSRLSGVNQTPLTEGIHFVMPFVYSVVVYDVRLHKFTHTSDCSTADLQDIKVELALNYRIDTGKVSKIHQTIGHDYEDKVIYPSMEESIKASTAKFRIEEVITKRQELHDKAKELIAEKLKDYGIILQDVSIMNIKFSEKYTASVENKQIQEQGIKTKEYEKKQAEEDAQKRKILADAQAYEQNKLRQTISKDVIQLEWIKKWDGKLPAYMGGNTQALLPVK